jgi:hypothetical protein
MSGEAYITELSRNIMPGIGLYYQEAGIIESVSMATSYGLTAQGSIPGRARDFSPLHCVQTGSEAHPASYPMGTGDFSPGGTVAGV